MLHLTKATANGFPHTEGNMGLVEATRRMRLAYLAYGQHMCASLSSRYKWRLFKEAPAEICQKYGARLNILEIIE